MNICLCVSWYFPDSIGGTESYVHALAIFLKQQGHNITVFKPGSKGGERYFYDDIEVKTFFPGNAFSKPMFLGLEAPDLTDFEKKLKELQPDVVHFHSLTGPSGISIFHVERARQIAAKVFFTFHLPHLTCATSTFKYLKTYDCDGVAEQHKCAVCLFAHQGWPTPAAKVFGKFSNLLNEGNVKVLGHNPILTRLGSAQWIALRQVHLDMLSYLCDRLICLSSWFYDVLKKNKVNTDKLALIEQGVLMPGIESINKTKEPVGNADPIRLVFLGRLDPIKGLSLLLSAIKGFNVDDYILDLYGPADQTYLQWLQHNFGKRNTMYKGVLKRDEVMKALSKYDAIVVPSLVTEMAPLVLQEAFAAGIPAIASDVAGNADFIQHGINGWLFKSGSEESLKQTFSWLLENKGELTTIRNQVSPVRTMNNIGNEHLELYLN